MRQAADELRAELMGDTVTYVVNRNVNVSNVCIVGCAFCGFGQGRRSPDAYEHDRDEFVRRAATRPSTTARPSCACSRASTPTGRSRTTWAGCAWRATRRRRCTCTPTRRWRSRTCATSRACRPTRCSRAWREAGLGSTPGTAAEVLHDGVRERISPNKLPGGALGRDHRGVAPRRAALDLDGDVRPRRGAVGAGRAHARRARDRRAHGRDHRVRAAVVHPVQHAARAHARRRGDHARGEPQAHRRLPPRARALDPQRAGQLGEDGPRRRHRGAALGRQRPRRHAHGGVDQPPGRLLPRGASSTRPT